MSFPVFIKSEKKAVGKLVLFQTGNYQYEIWNPANNETVHRLYDHDYSQAIEAFNATE